MQLKSKAVRIGCLCMLSGVMSVLAACANPAKTSETALKMDQDQQIAQDYLRQHYRLSAHHSFDQQLRLREKRTDELGFRHLFFTQRVQGVPVWRGQLNAHINREGAVYRLDGVLLNLPPTFKTTPSLLPEHVQGTVYSQHRVSKEAVVKLPVLFIYNQSAPQLVYYVEIHQGLKRYGLLLDAHTGALIQRIEGSYSLQGETL